MEDLVIILKDYTQHQLEDAIGKLFPIVQRFKSEREGGFYPRHFGYNISSSLREALNEETLERERVEKLYYYLISERERREVCGTTRELHTILNEIIPS